MAQLFDRSGNQRQQAGSAKRRDGHGSVVARLGQASLSGLLAILLARRMFGIGLGTVILAACRFLYNNRLNNLDGHRSGELLRRWRSAILRS